MLNDRYVRLCPLMRNTGGGYCHNKTWFCDDKRRFDGLCRDTECGDNCYPGTRNSINSMLRLVLDKTG